MHVFEVILPGCSTLYARFQIRENFEHSFPASFLWSWVKNIVIHIPGRAPYPIQANQMFAWPGNGNDVTVFMNATLPAFWDFWWCELLEMGNFRCLWSQSCMFSAAVNAQFYWLQLIIETMMPRTDVWRQRTHSQHTNDQTTVRKEMKLESVRSFTSGSLFWNQNKHTLSCSQFIFH